MGQYFKPVILGEAPKDGEHEVVKSWSLSHDYGSGLKLMEHSWMKSDFVQAFEKQLSRRGEHYKSRVVWAGDYAEGEPGRHLVEDDKEYKLNLYSLCNDENKFNPEIATTENYNFIVNHTKKQFVDKSKVAKDKDGWQIHPLPLLTCEGNGQGGGDFFGEDEKGLIGSWARDVISVESENPKLYHGTMDYTELIFDLTE